MLTFHRSETMLLAFVTLAAGAGPFWRAVRVDPVIALRQT
jgi:ABC-type antimicrobial peptide transport system permease subunit